MASSHVTDLQCQSDLLRSLHRPGARVSWGPFLHLDAMARFEKRLASLQG
jgi:hypothetical protein